MYNYDICSNAATDNADPAAASRAAEQAVKILELFVPSKHTARAKTGSLAKLLAWQCERPLQSHEVLCHQSDFVSSRLIYEGLPSPPIEQKVITSDWHNCLKLGYDVINDEWPSWMNTCLEGAGMSNPFGEQTNVIPLRIISPGDAMGTISPTVASRFGLSLDTIVVGGTTDSNAAFFAAAGAQPKIGTAVTSLGSTLAIKLLSQQYIEDADLGVYSHRFPSFSASSSSSRSYSSSSDFSSRSSPELQTQWLVGGASNVGCAIFRELKFSNTELDKLSQWIDPDADSPLSYYPLVKPGERFPTADSNKAPIIEPVPESRLEYLHGLLQSIARIERDGFRALYELGSPIPSIVWTCGGGSRNDVWTRMRQRILSANWEESSLSGDNIDASNVNCNDDMPSAPQLQVMRATNTEASYGAALLAAASYLAKGSE
jgi:xylulokinase